MKKIWLILIVLGLTLPLIQYQTKWISVKDLHGSFHKTKMPVFSIHDWFNNKFQNQYDSYFNQNFGFRSEFVRLHNQIKYSTFNEVNASGVIVGKEDYLYEKQYVKSYFGDDYLGQDQIDSRIKTIDSIYQILKKHQTELLIILAPGKGYYYPEYIPDSMVKERGAANYEGYLKAIKEKQIPFIDFNDLFLKMKDTSSIMLFPKTGIHWSQAIIPYVMDTIIRKVESQLNQDLANVIWEYPPPVKTADKQDADIERGLNLYFPLEIPPMTYPITSFEQSENVNRPKLISIADSFWWQIFNKGISKKVFKDGKFWYYYKQVYPDFFKDKTMVEDVYVKEELYHADIVILMATDANLFKFPYGFNKALEWSTQDDLAVEKEIPGKMNYIRSNQKWFNSVKVRAEKRNISVDSMLYLDARHVLKAEFKKR